MDQKDKNKTADIIDCGEPLQRSLSDDVLVGYDRYIKKIGSNEFIYYIEKRSSTSSSSSSTTTESVEPSTRIITVDCLCKINKGIRECCNIF